MAKDKKMILSVSRRTDIPSYYAEWFYNRIKEGLLCVRNPMNKNQISEIPLSPDIILFIVFWTKYPSEEMIKGLSNLKKYKFYFQFTLNNYGIEIEENIPNLKKRIESFKELSKKIGKEKVIWRYDPILLNEKYTESYHFEAFEKIAKELKEYTNKVIISFIDMYAKTARNTKDLSLKEISEEEMKKLAEGLKKIATKSELEIESCAEKVNLDEIGIKHGACIDKKLIEEIIGQNIKDKKDNQRDGCLCIKCDDVGKFNTCKNSCKYCYANYNNKQVEDNYDLYDPKSSFLCDDEETNEKTKRTKRKGTIVVV
ncbi:MAG: DUF1848 domain-containing protein [Methanobrevibacter sp.]|jgi:DNA repair photolyase|nr:DUF1848 domain-containing protein [Methanobrevibacter sp.]